jgi:hypothetical protein
MNPVFDVRFLDRKSGDGVGNKAGRLNHAVWLHNAMSMCGRRVASHGMKYMVERAGTAEITCPICLQAASRRP